MRKIDLVPASKIQTETVNWLIPEWIPASCLALFVGREGIGKSTIACDWAAQATLGELTGTPMNVAYIVTEDSLSHTVVPRLKAAGADLSKVMFINATEVDEEDPNLEYTSSLELPRDFALLESAIEGENIGLVILDAAKSVMQGNLDGNSDQAVRRFLEPMSRIAQNHNCVFIGLAHLSAKAQSMDSGRLILGSSAWSQVARSVVVAAKDEDNDCIQVWNSKSNLATHKRVQEARLVSTSIALDNGDDADIAKVEWGEESENIPTHLLSNEGGKSEEDDDRNEVEAWLSDYLAMNGETLKRDVLNAAKKEGFTVRKTLERALKKVGGTSRMAGYPKTAHWSIDGVPTDPTDPPHKNDVPTVPTGADLHKHGVPTGDSPTPNVPTDVPTEKTPSELHKRETKNAQNSSWDKPQRERGTNTVSQLSQLENPVRNAILQAVSDTHPITAGAITKQVKSATGDDSTALAEIDQLIQEGKIIENKDGKYLKTKKSRHLTIVNN